MIVSQIVAIGIRSGSNGHRFCIMLFRMSELYYRKPRRIPTRTIVAIMGLFLAWAPSFSSMADEDPYAILGVSLGDDLVRIKQKYRKLVFDHHPDRQPDLSPEARKKADEFIKKVNNAYALIGERKPEQSFTNTKEPKPKREKPHRTVEDNFWFYDFADTPAENWGKRFNWSAYAQSMQLYHRGVLESKAKADQVLLWVYPDFSAKKTSSSPTSKWQYYKVQEILANLYAEHEFSGFLGYPPDPDPLGVAIAHGAIGFKDAYGKMAMTAFIYDNLPRLRYIPAQALEKVSRTEKYSTSWGKITGRQLVSALLPFIVNLQMRYDLILNTMLKSGSATEFAELSALYLHEFSTRPKKDLPKAWAQIERALSVRGEGLQIDSIEGLLQLHYSLNFENWAPGRTAHENALRQRELWLGQLSLKEKFNIYPSMIRELGQDDRLEQDFLDAIDSALSGNVNLRLLVRSYSEELNPSLRLKVLDIVKSHGILGRARKALKECKDLLAGKSK